MYLIIISSILFFIMLLMLVFNKRLARLSFKDIAITNITSYAYLNTIYKKEGKNNGSIPVPIINQFYINNAFFIIKNKIIKNKPLDKNEKLLYESKEFSRRQLDIFSS